MLLFFKRYRMQIDLRGLDIGEIDLPENYSFLPWRKSLAFAHAEAKFRSFRDEMDANVFPCLGNIDGCQHLIKEISSRGNFVPESTWLLTHEDPSRNVAENCGTVQGILDSNEIGLLQNIGIVKSFRGLGLGSLLVRKSLVGLQTSGAKIASLEVTTHNVGAIRLYERLGFQIRKTVYKPMEIPDQ